MRMLAQTSLSLTLAAVSFLGTPRVQAAPPPLADFDEVAYLEALGQRFERAPAE